MLAYSTSPGKQAVDGDGRNSPYTRQLIYSAQKDKYIYKMKGSHFLINHNVYNYSMNDSNLYN